MGPRRSLRTKISDWFAPFVMSAQVPTDKRSIEEPINGEAHGSAQSGEISPPWVEYPGFPPGDFFWREAGEPWRTLVWEPYYNSLDAAQQAAYLERWKVPDDWRQYYFDPELRKWWESTDEPEA